MNPQTLTGGRCLLCGQYLGHNCGEVRAAILAERERCAKLCEEFGKRIGVGTYFDLAEKIREKPK